MTQFSRFSFIACLLVMATVAAAQDGGDPEALLEAIDEYRSTGRLRTDHVEIASADLLAEIYVRRNYALAWQDHARVAELIEAIEATHEDGLNPADYNLTFVRRGFEALRDGTELSAEQRADLELLFTDSLIRLGYHQRFGKVNPYTLDPHWNFRREIGDRNPIDAINRLLDGESLAAGVEALFPRAWFYSILQQGLVKYRRIEAAGGWPRVPEGPTLRPDADDERVPVLARRLAASGDLDDAAPYAGVSQYGDRLQDAVRGFQRRHDLDVDGVIGPSTLAAMNVPVERRVRQFEVNLERARWVMDDLEDSFVLVNIAGFRAYVFREREIVWETRVQVGRTYRQTPVFRGTMKYLVFSPTWTVPYSIATEDILPQLRKDPNYLIEREFDVRDRNGALVDPLSVDWSALPRGSFPYTLVQRPGPANALGRVKFMFPNEHAVYLHDTPSKYLFDRADRSFSSGCIRVEKPFELAEILLGWDQQRIQETLDRRELKNVMLPEPMPVLLLYWTAGVDDNGVVYFHNDIYDRDENIARALEAPFVFEPPEI